MVGSTHVHVCVHGKKRFVIALKYPSETVYRWQSTAIESGRNLISLIQQVLEADNVAEQFKQLG